MTQRVITSSHVFTGLSPRTRPLALVCEDDRIEAVIPRDQVRELVRPGATIEDWGDHFICAGLNDAHQHVFHAALFPSDLAIEYCGTGEIDCAWRLYEFAENQPYGSWAIGHGWRDALWKSPIAPTRLSLDAVFPARPAVFYSGDSHTIWLNTAGLKALGITDDTVPPAGGSFDRDEDGRLTGVVREGAGMYYMAKVLETLTRQQKEEVMAAWMRELNRRGVTSVSDMGLSAVPGCDMVLDDVWESLLAQGRLTVRGHLFPTLPLDGDLTRIKDLQARLAGPMLRAPGVKQFFDGVSSQHTAWLLEPYANPAFPGDCGHPAMPPEEMRNLVLAAAAEGVAVRIHTIGDAAVHAGVDIMEEAVRRFGQPRQGRFCLEHLENLERSDVARMARAGIVASVQPQHAVIDIEQPARDLGDLRASYMWPFHDYLAQGTKMAFGTDAPCVPMDPAAILHDAVTRQTAAGDPAGGWFPEQRVSMAQAIRALTFGSAQAEGREQELGTLQPGRLADVIVVDRNPLAICPESLHDCRVLACYVGARHVFDA